MSPSDGVTEGSPRPSRLRARGRVTVVLSTALVALALSAAVSALSLPPIAQADSQKAGAVPDPTKALFEAVAVNDLNAVKAAVAAGADVTATNKSGLRPMDVAVDKGFFIVAHFLLSVRDYRRSVVALTTAPPAPSAPAKPPPKPPLPPETGASLDAPAVPPPPDAWPDAESTDQERAEGTSGDAAPVAGAASAEIPAEDEPGASERADLGPAERSAPAKPEASPRPVGKEGESRDAGETAQPASSATPAPPAAAEVPPPSPSEAPKASARPEETASLPAERGDAEAPPKSYDSEPSPFASATPARFSGTEWKRPTISLVSAKAMEITDLMDQLVDFFEPGAANENRRQNVRAAPQPAGSLSAEFLAAKEGGWSVKDVIRSGGTAAGRAKLGAAAKDYLAGVKLTLGRSVELGSTLDAQRTDPASRKPCIKKKGGRVAFCIRAIDWPDEVRDYFLVSTVMYIGPKAVARFDEGSATRFYTLFETEVFDEVVDYFSRRFGPPTETLNRSIAPLAEPRQDNPTAIWRSVNPVTKQVTALEIRKFDDTRGGFPDRRHGAVLLYKKYSDPIFPTVSPLELMALRPNEPG